MYDSPAGMPVGQAIRKIVKKANKKNQPVQTTFNGVKLVARPGDSAQTILVHYWQLKS